MARMARSWVFGWNPRRAQDHFSSPRSWRWATASSAGSRGEVSPSLRGINPGTTWKSWLPKPCGFRWFHASWTWFKGKNRGNPHVQCPRFLVGSGFPWTNLYKIYKIITNKNNNFLVFWAGSASTPLLANSCQGNTPWRVPSHGWRCRNVQPNFFSEMCLNPWRNHNCDGLRIHGNYTTQKDTGSEWDLFVFKPHRGEFISKGVWDHFISCKIKSGIDEMSYYNSYAGHLWLEQLSWFMFMLYAKFIITYDQDISRLYTITRTVSHYLSGPPFGGWGARKNIRSSGWLVLHTANIRAEAWLGPTLLTAWEFGAIRLLSSDCNLRSGGCIAFLHIIYIYTVTYI